jgi:hypothetical protein
MKVYVILAIMLTLTVFIVVNVYALADSKVQPKDEPNFKPTITKGTFNGKDVEIIEFKSKLAK